MKRKWARYFLLIPALLVVLVGLSAASNLFFPRSSKLVDRLSAEEKARAAEVIHLRQELGNEVWPGFGDAAILRGRAAYWLDAAALRRAAGHGVGACPGRGVPWRTVLPAAAERRRDAAGVLRAPGRPVGRVDDHL